jgi:hypothetical protein
VRDRGLRIGESYLLAVGRARRQLALGDDMSLVYADEKARLGLRRRHGGYRSSAVTQSNKSNKMNTEQGDEARELQYGAEMRRETGLEVTWNG